MTIGCVLGRPSSPAPAAYFAITNTATTCLTALSARIEVLEGDRVMKSAEGEMLSRDPLAPHVLAPLEQDMTSIPVPARGERIRVSIAPLIEARTRYVKRACTGDLFPYLDDALQAKMLSCEDAFRARFGHFHVMLGENRGSDAADQFLRAACFEQAQRVVRLGAIRNLYARELGLQR